MTITERSSEAAPPVTTLFGDLPDQAALAGVLNTLYDLHLAVLSVERLSAEWQYSKGEIRNDLRPHRFNRTGVSRQPVQG